MKSLHVLLAALLAGVAVAQQSGSKPAIGSATKPVDRASQRAREMRDQIKDGRVVTSHVKVRVKLKNGKVIKAKKAVVSNATAFDTVKMLPDGGDAPELPEGVREWKKTLGKLPRHGAIMHLFLAIDATDLELSHIEDPAHLVVQVGGAPSKG